MPRKPSLHTLATQADQLSLGDFKQLVAYLNEQIQERESCASTEQPTPETGWRSEYRKCGKSNCRYAAGGQLRVRDEIRHSYDYQMNPVTCRASDVLRYRTGYCYAKSHLLAALLRANRIPAGLCYQRLSMNDTGAPYCLHGLNAVYLPEIGWYRMDARGNRLGVDAQFTPPIEQLAFKIQSSEEVDFPMIFAELLDVVVQALQRYRLWDELLQNLPDCSLEDVQGNLNLL